MAAASRHVLASIGAFFLRACALVPPVRTAAFNLIFRQHRGPRDAHRRARVTIPKTTNHDATNAGGFVRRVNRGNFA